MAEQTEQQQVNDWQPPKGEGIHDDPLLDCLVALTRFHHSPISIESLRAGLPLEDSRFTPDLFIRAAARAGLSARVVKRPLKKIHDLVLPAVLLLGERQACVLLEKDETKGTARILAAEAGMGEIDISVQELEARYLGYAIFAQPEYKFDARAPETLALKSRHWFWGTLFSSWRIYRDVLVASFLINVFALASPLFIMNVYDRVVPNNAVETLWVLAIGVSVVYGFDLLMKGLRGYFIDIAGKKADITLSTQIFEQVMGIKMAARPPSVGAFANNLREFDSVRDFITSATITTLIDLPFILLFLAVISFIGGPLVLVPALGMPLILIYGLIIQAPLRRAVENSFRMATQRNATLVESLTGLETVKTLGAEGAIQKKWEKAVGYMAHWGVRSRILSASAVNVAVALQQLATVGVVVFGVYLITEGAMSMGGLIACVILTGRAMAPMAQVASLATRYHQARAALQSLNSIMALPQERPFGRSFLHRPVFKGSIEFHDVTFSYPGQSNAALTNLTFSIKAGEKVALIGRIGSGKTTVEKLIMGLYEPDSGAVRVDGTDLRQVDPADLRRNVGYIPQDTNLFFGTVRDNIMMGAPYADDAAVLRAANVAGVNEFVDRHPLGFDMQIGERGEGLSGGQRQTIAVARAMLLNPPMLLMDEPTSSMDNATEDRLKTRLTEEIGDKTLILVTHRASLLELVQRIIVLDNGRVIADGPKAQVLEALRTGKLRVAMGS
jgi:ATP-binding cassette subfamily C protein LapB